MSTRQNLGFRLIEQRRRRMAGGSSGTAVTLLTHTSATNTDGGSHAVTTSAIDTTGATFLVAALIGDGGTAPETTVVTDSKGNTWTAINLSLSATPPAARLFYAANPTVGTGHTFSGAGNFQSVLVAAFSHVATTSPFDQQNAAFSDTAVATIQPGSITPSAANELVITALAGSPSVTSPSVNSGFTILETVAGGSGLHYAASLAYLVQTTAVAVNPTWTYGVSSNGQTAIASFKNG